MKQQKKVKITQLQLQKQQRLMAALRANLRKRKGQIKARQEGTNINRQLEEQFPTDQQLTEAYSE
jgi:hypothetical protein